MPCLEADSYGAQGTCAADEAMTRHLPAGGRALFGCKPCSLWLVDLKLSELGLVRPSKMAQVLQILFSVPAWHVTQICGL